ncbi:hypothetical protein [Streptomyces sp. NPDC057557]|uniref:hypothetical protein n=1 Tax=Streptomyces sp. NPDC057557 TaxID=3346167 RepID=UPI0036CBEF73
MDQVIARQRYLNGDGYWDWGGLDANNRIGGYFLWVFEDYGTNDVYQKSGAVDIDRYPKYCYHWLKSMQPANNSNHGGPMVFVASAHTAHRLEVVAEDAGGRAALIDLLAFALGDSSQDGKKAARKLLDWVEPGQAEKLVDLAGSAAAGAADGEPLQDGARGGGGCHRG